MSAAEITLWSLFAYYVICGIILVIIGILDGEPVAGIVVGLAWPFTPLVFLCAIIKDVVKERIAANVQPAHERWSPIIEDDGIHFPVRPKE